MWEASQFRIKTLLIYSSDCAYRYGNKNHPWASKAKKCLQRKGWMQQSRCKSAHNCCRKCSLMCYLPWDSRTGASWMWPAQSTILENCSVLPQFPHLPSSHTSTEAGDVQNSSTALRYCDLGESTFSLVIFPTVETPWTISHILIVFKLRENMLCYFAEL